MPNLVYMFFTLFKIVCVLNFLIIIILKEFISVNRLFLAEFMVKVISILGKRMIISNIYNIEEIINLFVYIIQ